MPIHCPILIEPLSDQAFEAIDKVVMRCAYDSQNELGRLCDEKVYENDIANRLRSEGLQVRTQVPVTISHRGFSKVYRLDLVAGGVIYELKTAAALTSDHEAQAIHYAVMLGTTHAKLINLRSPKVAGLLKCSPLHRVDRTAVAFDTRRWQLLDRRCEELLGNLRGFLSDIGAYLEASLYEEALIHFWGGEAKCVRRVPVARSGAELGDHLLACHTNDIGFVVTTFTFSTVAYEQQLRRLLRLTPLIGIQWLNLSHAELQAVTLKNDRELRPRLGPKS
jgi:GxxExxY protein